MIPCSIIQMRLAKRPGETGFRSVALLHRPSGQRYTDLIQVHEPFEHNVGWKKGALVSAPVGKGRWIFVGLGLWRQVAAGTDGAYQLLANLVSRGKLPGK